MKKVLSVLLAAIMVVSLAACGSTAEAPAATEAATEAAATEAAKETEAATTAAPAAEKQEEVTLYVYQQGIDAIDAWQELLRKFEAENPNVTCELMDSQDNYYATILTTGDCPDIINIDIGDIGNAMIDAGLIGNAGDTEVAKHVSADVIAKETYNGTVIGIPQGSAFPLVYYNMDMLKDAGWDKIPENRDEFIQCCADLKAAGHEAFTLPAGENSNPWMFYENVLANTSVTKIGVDEFQKQLHDGTYDFTAYEDAEKFLSDLAPYIMPGTANFRDDDALAEVANGNVAMMMAGNWMSGVVIDAFATSTGDRTHVDASLPPFNAAGEDARMSVTFETPIGFSAVDGGEAHNAARLALFEFIFKPENYQILQNARGCIPVTDDMTADQIKLDACITNIIDKANNAQTIPYGGGGVLDAEFKNEARVSLREAFSGNITAAEAEAQMKESIGKYNKNGQ